MAALVMAWAIAAPPASSAAPNVVGNWRIYSQRLDYDSGGSTVGATAPGTLKLRSNRTWQFGSSKGRWSTGRITAADWRRWNAEPYGPTTKIILKNFAKQTATGPIEVSTRVDFIWVNYRVKPPTVSRPGMMHTKFGRVTL